MQADEARTAGRVFRFDAFEVDLRTKELSREGRRIKLHGMPCEVLAALLERPGEMITREELQKKLWPDGTFVDFDNNLNSAVKRLRDALGDSAEHPRYIETLPRLGYRFIGDVRPPPGEASFSRSPAQAPGASAAERPRARGRLAAVAAVTVMVMLAAFAAWRWLGPTAARAGKVRLAVLPFENLSGDAEQEYLSAGFTEEMITQLARVDPERLDVIARTTVLSFKNRQESVAEIGGELGVDYVVEGSIRMAEGRLRVTSQLIQVQGQTHVWAQNYDRELQDLIGVQDEVSRAVAQHVRVVVAQPPQMLLAGRRSENPQAYQAYLRARYHQALGSVRDTELAISFFRKAIELDPQFAAAHAGIARSFVFGVRIRPREALALAHASAMKALEIAPELPEAQAAVGLTKLYSQWDWAGAAAAFREALELDPGNAEIQFHYAQCLVAQGRFDEAIAAARKAQRLDPFAPLIGHYIGRLYFFARQFEKAEEEFRKTIEINPGYTWTYLFRALNFEQLGEWDAAVAGRQKYWSLLGRKPEEVARLREIYAASGYEGVRREWARWIQGFVQADGYVTSAELALLHARLGETDTAFRWLERALEDHTRDMIFLHVHPAYDLLRSDARFSRLLVRYGFPTDGAA